MTTAERIADFVQETQGLDEEGFLAEHPYPFLVQEDTGAQTPEREDRSTMRLRGSAAAPRGSGGFLQGNVRIHRVYPRHEPADDAGDQPPGVRIGRDEACDLILDDGSISQVHATFGIRHDDDGERVFTLADAGSSNGTFHNGERLEPEQVVALEDNDSVRLGPAVKLQFFTAPQFFQFLSLYRRIKR